jgi:hypothetical protein
MIGLQLVDFVRPVYWWAAVLVVVAVGLLLWGAVCVLADGGRRGARGTYRDGTASREGVRRGAR